MRSDSRRVRPPLRLPRNERGQLVYKVLTNGNDDAAQAVSALIREAIILDASSAEIVDSHTGTTICTLMGSGGARQRVAMPDTTSQEIVARILRASDEIRQPHACASSGCDWRADSAESQQ